MTQGNRYAYSENESAQAVKIPFGKQDRFVMAMYLPQRNDSKAFFESLESSVQKLNSSFSNTPGTIVIPRFKVEYGNEEMVSVLGALGVAQSFSDAANFKGITYEDSKINKIIHKAVIEVNEEGAEAAAATVIGGARTTSVPVDLPFFFQADHPFYYEIRDEKTDVILFSGILNEPKQK